MPRERRVWLYGHYQTFIGKKLVEQGQSAFLADLFKVVKGKYIWRDGDSKTILTPNCEDVQT